MAWYNTCEYCGANLDPGEKCDCQSEESDPPKIIIFKEPETTAVSA